MGVLEIVSLLTAGLTLFYNVTKSLSESLLYFWIVQTDNNRLKDILTDKRKLDQSAFTFSLLTLSIALTFSFVIVNAVPNRPDRWPVAIYNNLFTISFMLIALVFLIYAFAVFKRKNKRVLRIADTDGSHWYLHGRLSNDMYLFKDSKSKEINKLKLKTKAEMIELFDGFVDVDRPSLGKKDAIIETEEKNEQ